MKHLIGLVIVTIALSTQWSSGVAMGAQRHATLLVYPSTLRPGDSLYVSGGGYTTRGHVPIAISCPTSQAPLYGNFGYVGPQPGADGTFAAYHISVPTPRGTHAIRCQVVARHIGRGSAAGIWGTPVSVTVVPGSQPLPRCAIQICVTTRAFLVRLRSGVQGNISILGWPGARATVTIDRVGAPPIRRSIRLSWQGAYALRIMVAPGLARGLKSHIRVVANLGRATGVSTAVFVVLPGGR